MDDVFVWSDDRDELIEKGRLFENFINNDLLLTLKTLILNKTGHGLPALGFLVYPDEIRLNARSKKRFATKMKKNCKLLENDEITEANYAQSVLSLYGFISHAKHKGFARSVINMGTAPKALTA
jgi:hypothetical protein